MEFSISMVEIFLLVTAILFTYVGKFMARAQVKKDIGEIVEHTIDGLIKDGYIKSRKTLRGEIELIKVDDIYK